MRLAVPVFALIIAACSSGEITLESYVLGDVTRIATHCAVADPVIAADSADGLPLRGQTDLQRVEDVVAQSRVELLEAYSGVDATVVARDGQVWSNRGGVVTIADAADYQILVTITGDAQCPTAPEFWNGVPLLFYREGFLD